MATVEVKLVSSNVDEIKKMADGAIDKALEMIGMQVENYAKLLCPVDTGRLRNSITHDKQGEMTEVIGTDVEYAAYVEMGTRKTTAQPYLKPAVEEHISEYQQIVEECLHNA